MRVAIYIRSVKSARGAERASINLAKGLADRGHRVDFLVEKDKGWLLDSLRAHSQRIRIISLRSAYRMPVLDGAFRFLAVVANLVSSPSALLRGEDTCIKPLFRFISKTKPPIFSLFTYIMRTHPDAIISLLNDANLVTLLAAQLLRARTKFIVSVQNHISTAASHGKGKWERAVPRFMHRFFRLADGIAAVSLGVAEDVAQISGLPRERIHEIYNPVFQSGIATMAQEPVEHPWFKQPQVPVVLAAGKLELQKDFETLLRAFARIREQKPMHLVILGEGSRRDRLAHLAQDLGIQTDVNLAGFVRNPYAFFSRAAVFVLSSAWEGLPTVLIEAMACGCPVVSTDCPSGPAEILEGGKYGPLVPVGDAAALAQAVLFVLKARPDPEQLRTRAAAFSVDASVDRYLEFLAQSPFRKFPNEKREF